MYATAYWNTAQAACGAIRIRYSICAQQSIKNARNRRSKSSNAAIIASEMIGVVVMFPTSKEIEVPSAVVFRFPKVGQHDLSIASLSWAMSVLRVCYNSSLNQSIAKELFQDCTLLLWEHL